MQIHSSVLLISILLMLVILAIFIFIGKNATEQQEYQPIQTKAYKFRSVLFWTLLVFGIIFTSMTLTKLPYAGSSSTNQMVDAVGHQWYWEVSENVVEAGKPVQFNVTSADVNHGLGIYDENLTLVAQTQAMPSYENTLVHTFEKPGIYKFLCLEFCGLAHHAMAFELTVVEQSQ